jgi:TPR repeat protein
LLLSTFLAGAMMLAAPAAMAQGNDGATDLWNYANGGDPVAQAKVGSLYSKGAGVVRSDSEAYRWFRRAAQQGHAESQLMMSGYLATGKVVSKDLTSAYQWAYLAGTNAKNEESYQTAIKMLNTLAAGMTQDQVAEAQQRAAAWRATPEVTVAAPTVGRPAIALASAQTTTAPAPATAPAQYAAVAPAAVRADVAPARVAATAPAAAEADDEAPARPARRSHRHRRGYHGGYQAPIVVVVRPGFRVFRPWRPRFVVFR